MGLQPRLLSKKAAYPKPSSEAPLSSATMATSLDSGPENHPSHKAPRQDSQPGQARVRVSTQRT